MTMRERRLFILVAVHLALGVVTATLARITISSSFGLEHITVVPLCALALCQAALLALWVTTSEVSLWARSLGLVTGAIYLEALIPGDLRHEFQGASTSALIVTTATLLVARALRVRPIRRDADATALALAQHDSEGLRFSIRALMVVTAAFALLSAGSRALRESGVHAPLLVLVWSLCFVIVGLAAFWAGLANARPLARAPVVCALSPILGIFFAFAATAHERGWVYITLIMLLYPALLLASLLVVRSCGYRLVPLAVPIPGECRDFGVGV
jgi:hypothetical protein